MMQNWDCSDRQVSPVTYWTQRTRTKLDYFYIDNELYDGFEYSSFDAAKTIGADHVPGVMQILVPELRMEVP